MKKLSLLFFSIATLLLYNSCSKNDDVQNPDPTTIDSVDIMGFKDSTLLIKSLHSVYYNEDGTINDSLTGYINYDTVNRKIVITDGKGNETEEHTYNSKGLLIHTVEKDDGGDNITDYTYDESNILKSVTESDGTDNKTYTLNKTVLPSGNYQLSWEGSLEPNNPNFVEKLLVNFDSKGNTLSYYDYSNGKLSFSDSILYDAEGNISKVKRTLAGVSQPFIQFDFISRDTKGDEFYNFYRILYNGVANFPIFYAGIGGGYFSENFFQFFKYPALATDITNPDGNSFKTVRFNETPEYDSKNRLIKCKTFFNDDQLYVTEYSVSYYKN